MRTAIRWTVTMGLGIWAVYAVGAHLANLGGL